MDLLNSLDFLNENWELCMEDNDIKTPIQNGNFQALLELSPILSDQSDKENQNLINQCMSRDYVLIRQSENHIKSVINVSRDVQKGIDSIHLLEKLDNFQNNKVNPTIEFCQEMIKLEQILTQPEALVVFHSNTIAKNIQIFKDFVYVQSTLYKYNGCQQLFQSSYKKYKDYSAKNYSFVEDVLTNAFTSFGAQNIKILQNYYQYFVLYSKIYAQDSYNKIHNFQIEWVEKAAFALFNRSFGSYRSLALKSILGLNRIKFDYKNPKIRKILEFGENGIIPLDFFNREDLQKIEFSIIKFLIELPTIVPQRCYLFDQIFNYQRKRTAYNSDDNSFRSLFQERLEKYYIDFLNSKFKNDITNATFWIFIHRIALYIEITIPPAKEPFTSFIASIFNQTAQIAKQHCDELYKCCNIFKRINDLYEVEEKRYQNSRQKESDQEQLVQSLIKVFDEQIMPLYEVIHMCYYKVTTTTRSKGKWYNEMMKKMIAFKPGDINNWYTFATNLEHTYLFDSRCEKLIKTCMPKYGYYYYCNIMYRIDPIKDNTYFKHKLISYLKEKVNVPYFRYLFTAFGLKTDQLNKIRDNYKDLVELCAKSILSILKTVEKDQDISIYAKNILVSQMNQSYQSVYNQSKNAHLNPELNDISKFVMDLMQYFNVN